MIDFLENHPEYERIEYQGELRTMEDLDVILDEVFEAIEIF